MIRVFRPQDLDEVLRIWLQSNLEAHAFIPPQYWQGQAPVVRTLLPQAELYVFEADDSPGLLGFLGLTGSYVEGLFVRREVRSLGIGRQLLDHAKALKSGLALHVYEKNSRAVHFYRREGFRVQAEGTDGNTGERELVMSWTRAGNGGLAANSEEFTDGKRERE